MDHPNGRSRSPVVRQLVKLPIFDRVKVVKDLMVGQLDFIHAQLLAVQDMANALLANDSPLLESSITLAGAVHDARLAIDRQSQLVLDTLQHARQDVFGQTLEILNLVRQRGDELRQRGQVLLDAIAAGQDKAERQAEDVLDAVQASARETSEQHRALLGDARQAREEAQHHAQGILDILRCVREEMREQEQRLLETLPARHHGGEDQAAVLLEAIRATRAETREHAQALIDQVLRTQEEAQAETRAFLADVRDDARRRAQEHLDDRQRIREETDRQSDRVLALLQGNDDAHREQNQQLLDAMGELNRRVAQSGEQIESALSRLQVLADDGRQTLHAALDRIRFRSSLVKSGPARVLPLYGTYAGEPEAGLMAHLYAHVPSRVALDIGANVGDVSHQLLAAGYEVFAFEPHAEVFRQLTGRFHGHPAFHGFPLALGSANETRPLHLAADRSGCNRYRDSTLYSSLLHHAMPDDLVFTGTIPVTVRTLASLHAAGHLPPNVGVVKIDTEGFDLEVIRGMDSHRYPVVVAEYWDQATPFGESGAMNRLDDLVQEMRSRDYHWYIVFYRVWGKSGTSFYCNNAHSVPGAFGNVYFFRDQAIFGEALKWCAAVLPVTYLGG